jgi:ABC-type branched-subunit amino acid transport system ATPase component
VTGWRPDQIFRAGVSRTFQGVRLFEHLTVYQNVRLAARSAPAAHLAPAADGPKPASAWLDRARARARTERALGEVGLDRSLWDAAPDRLTLLERRLVEIARALTVQPLALLLDEPAAGLNTAEKQRLCALFERLTAAIGCRIVVVEHDMKLVMSIAERICVMNFGRLLREGAPEDIRTDEAVIEAYLGTREHHG